MKNGNQLVLRNDNVENVIIQDQALEFKNKGNKWFKTKEYQKAIGCYQEGVDKTCDQGL